MKLLPCLRISTRSLQAHPVRSGLTGLGVAVGVAATVLVSSLGLSVETALDQQLEAVGKTLLLVRGDSKPLSEADAALLRSDPLLTSLTRGVAPASTRPALVRYRSLEVATTFDRVHPDAFAIRHWKLAAGRLPGPYGRVCVLGETARRRLFGSASGLGQTVQTPAGPLRVVGTLLPKGRDPLGRDHDDVVFTIRDGGPVDVIVADAASEALIAPAVERVRILLRQSHRLLHGIPDDFEVTSVAEMAELGVAVTSTLGLLTTLLAGVSLLVGGTLVLATMLAAASERVRETGLRLALGATPDDVLTQMLLEAAILAGAGGVVGLLAGLLLDYLACGWLDWPLAIPLAVLPAAPVGTALLGLLAGAYPAVRASRLTPMEALRHD